MSISLSSDLTINLRAIAQNWLQVKSMLVSGADCGAVIKANAYGLGVEPVLQTLVRAGCRSFCVANLREALTVKNAIAKHVVDTALKPGDFRVIVLSGCAPGEELPFIENRLIPVLISREMLSRWVSVITQAGIRPGSVSAILKLDSGMSRLGLSLEDFDQVLSVPVELHTAGVNMLMSHLACADTPEHFQNARQIECFGEVLRRLRAIIPGAGGSLANSAGVLLGTDYHFNLVRPGIALYGGNPRFGAGNLFAPVVQLNLPVIQIRLLSAGGAVGYGATSSLPPGSRLAVVAGGYADGLLRSLSNRGACWVSDGSGGGWRVPICGRISMDSTVLDISRLPDGALQVGERVELLGSHVTVDDVAASAGTISYEILTSLGQRYQRAYIE